MFKLGRNFHYFRDGHVEFLKALLCHPRVQFAFYSSIMRKNILPIIQNMFKDDMGYFQEHMLALFDQTYNRAAPDITGEKWGQIRDLERVWSDVKLMELGKGLDMTFGPENTLMLDSDEISVHDCFQNALIVDRYDRDDVWPQDLS